MHFYTDRLRDFLRHKIFKAHDSEKFSPAQRIRIIHLRDEMEGYRATLQAVLKGGIKS